MLFCERHNRNFFTFCTYAQISEQLLSTQQNMKMKLPMMAGLLLAVFAIFQTACKKPTPFGSELLEDEYADYDYTDTITVQCTLLREDSVVGLTVKCASGPGQWASWQWRRS